MLPVELKAPARPALRGGVCRRQLDRIIAQDDGDEGAAALFCKSAEFERAAVHVPDPFILIRLP